MRLTKNIEQEQTRFLDFSMNVLAPVMAAMSIADTAYAKPIKQTARHIQDTYGKAASECFVLMFKRLTRGGYSAEQQAKYFTTWVPNASAIAAYLEWMESKPTEMTCRSLLQALNHTGADALEWHRSSKAWMSSALTRAARAAKNDLIALEDTTNYGHLKAVIIANTTATGIL